MKLFTTLFAAFAAATATRTSTSTNTIVDGCVSFSVSGGTGCAWMCNYCAGALGTNNYYFTTDVCTYEEGVGCVGSPQAGVTYTCCAAGDEIISEDVEAAEEEAEEDEATSCETESEAEEAAAEWDETITEICITEKRRRRA